MIDCSSACGDRAKPRRQDAKALLEDRRLRHNKPEDDCHEQDLSETIDRAGAQKENDQQGRDDDRASPYDGAAA